MNAEQLIDSYVSEVVAKLPRRQRADVAAELGALLREELTDREGEADEAAAMALLTSFGRPSEVAARYRPALTIIDPADSRAFLKAAVIGVALIWLVGLLNAFQHRPSSIADGLSVLQHFYFTVGLPALMWPGFLVVWFGLAGWARRRWPRTAVWKPRPAQRDRINRFGTASALVFFIAGTATLVNPGAALNFVSGGRLSQSAYAAFAYDPDFVRLRGPALLAVIAAQLVLMLVTLVRGRWEPATRRVYLVLNIVMCAVLIWVLVGGNTFSQSPTDQMMKAAIALTVLFVLVDLVLRIRRQRQRMATAAAPHTT
jgi:hypothetical protein